MPTSENDLKNFEIPEDLIEAIEMGSFERFMPRQGSPLIHKFLMDPEDEVAGKVATEWIEQQKKLWPEVDRVVIRLHEVAPVEDMPEWHHQPWWMTLTLPWSDGLKEAIRDADSWCDKRENAQPS
jgi:hypothetical protein